jgi:hypothetical protein
MLKSVFFSILVVWTFAANGQPVNDSVDMSRNNGQIKIRTDSLSAGSVSDKKETRKIAIVKKEVNYSGFVKLAIGMMCFIALFYTTAQTWNPG